MTHSDWLFACGFFLEAHGPFHFTAKEVCDVGRVEDGIVLRSPPPELLLNALELIPVLEWIRWWDGPAPVDVNSWYRDIAYNTAVGGSRGSLHMTCGAADISKRGWVPADLAHAIDQNHPESSKLGIGIYPTFVHVDVRGKLNRRAPARWPRDAWGLAA